MTAGFDHRDQFPWLDIALTFDGDTQLVAKRQHISADLLNLIETVVGAGAQDRNLIKRPDDWSMRQMPIASRMSESGCTKSQWSVFTQRRETKPNNGRRHILLI